MLNKYYSCEQIIDYYSKEQPKCRLKSQNNVENKGYISQSASYKAFKLYIQAM